MDPNETLRLIRLTIKQMAVEEKGGLMWTAHAVELIEYWTALDEWLKSGGFLPTEWTTGTTSTEWGVQRVADGINLTEPNRESAEATITYEANHERGIPVRLIARTVTHGDWRAV